MQTGRTLTRRAIAALALTLLSALFALGVRHDTATVIAGTASPAVEISQPTGTCWVSEDAYACAPAISPDGFPAGRIEEDASVTYPGSVWYFAGDEGRFLSGHDLQQPAETDLYTA